MVPGVSTWRLLDILRPMLKTMDITKNDPITIVCCVLLSARENSVTNDVFCECDITSNVCI
jgi:hypothetical protein